MTSHIMLDNSHMGNTWDWLGIISLNMMDGELRWWITLGYTPFIDNSFFQDDTLHWSIVSSPLHLGYDGLGVVGWSYTGA